MLYAQFPKGEKTAVTQGVYQWDRGRTLRIFGVFSGEAQVHFWQGGKDSALVCLPSREEDGLGCPIPDELLQRPEPIIAYLYLTDGSRKRTEYVITIPVFSRPGVGGTYTPGGTAVILEKTFRENGTYVPAEEKADGYGPVKVAVVPKLEARQFTQNGVYQPTPGFDGMGQVTVSVDSGAEPVILEKQITENGTYLPAEEAADGYGPVKVAVEPKLENRQITQNGTYTPSDGFDGFSQVVVTVDGGGPVKICEPYYETLNGGFFLSDGNLYMDANNASALSLYAINPGRRYLLHRGAKPGSRFRCALFVVDPRTFVQNTQVGIRPTTDETSPQAYSAVSFFNDRCTYLAVYLGVNSPGFEIKLLDITDLYPNGL